MPKRTTDYRSLLLEDLKDPEEAAQYLTAALRDSEEMFLLALRDVAEPHQMANVAGKVGVSRESLYRMLARSGNPTYHNFFGILKALDVAFDRIQVRGAVQAQPPPSPHRRRSRRGNPDVKIRSTGYNTQSPDESSAILPVFGGGPVNEVNASLSEFYPNAGGLFQANFIGTGSLNPSSSREGMQQVGQQQSAAA